MDREEYVKRFQLIFTDALCRGMLAFTIAIVIAYSTNVDISEYEIKAIRWAAVSIPLLSLALLLNSFHKADIGEHKYNGSILPIAIMRGLGCIFSLVASCYFFYSFSDFIGHIFLSSCVLGFFISLHGMSLFSK